MEELQKLVSETQHPDVICLQEVRLKASGKDHQRGKPLDSEFKGSVEEAMDTVFSDYAPFWSLADTKYAGTLTLIRRQCLKNNDMAMSDKANFSAFTPRSAIDLLMQRLGTNRNVAVCSSEK